MDNSREPSFTSIMTLIEQAYEDQKKDGLVALRLQRPLSPSNTAFSIANPDVMAALELFITQNCNIVVVRDVDHRFLHERILTIWHSSPARILDLNLTAEARMRWIMGNVSLGDEFSILDRSSEFGQVLSVIKKVLQTQLARFMTGYIYPHELVLDRRNAEEQEIFKLQNTPVLDDIGDEGFPHWVIPIRKAKPRLATSSQNEVGTTEMLTDGGDVQAYNTNLAAIRDANSFNRPSLGVGSRQPTFGPAQRARSEELDDWQIVETRRLNESRTAREGWGGWINWLRGRQACTEQNLYGFERNSGRAGLFVPAQGRIVAAQATYTRGPMSTNI